MLLRGLSHATKGAAMPRLEAPGAVAVVPRGLSLLCPGGCRMQLRGLSLLCPGGLSNATKGAVECC